MLFKGNSSRLELLIEKIQANKENTSTHDLKEALGSDPGSTSSWRSTDTVLEEEEVAAGSGEEDELAGATSRQRRRGSAVQASTVAVATAGGVKAARRSVSSASSSSVCSSGSHSSAPGAPEDLGFTLGVTEATPYPCQFCAKAFPRLSYLKKHEQSHAEHMPFRCEFCSRLFKHKRSRDRHVKLHTGDRKYRCTQCEAAFSRSDHLKIHMKTHDTQKPFQCSACNRGYNTAAALTSHSQTHKRPPSLPANLPPRSSPHQTQHQVSRSPPSAPPPRRVTPAPSPAPAFPRNLAPSAHHELLRAHPAAAAAAAVLFNRELQQVLQQQQEASARGGSPPSARNALNAAAMAAAALAHSAGLQFAAPTLACIYCTKDSFTSMESLQLHVQAMHGSILNGEIREYQPPSPAHHLPPSNAHHAGAGSVKHAASPTQPYSCDFCTMKFDNLQGLQKHTLAVHAMPAPPAPPTPAGLPLACAQCPAQFTSPTQHAEHVSVYHAEQLKPTDLSKKPANTNGKSSRSDKLPQNTLLCNQCNAPFPDFESFRTHLKTHLDAEQGKSISKRNLMNNNITTPHYQCTECDASFTSENALEIHSLGHFLTTTTEFSCQSCLKSFQRPDELQKHLMDIHSHHLYRCSLCREIFDSRVGAQVHFAVKHSNETRVLRCLACGENSAKFRTEMEFTLHVRVHHLTPHLEAQTMRQPPKSELPSPLLNQFRCLYCNDYYKSDTELQYHVANFHQKLFRCKICDESFHVEFLLDKHMESNHSSPNNEKITTSLDNEHNKQQNGEKELNDSKKLLNFGIKQSKSPNNMVVVSLVCAYCNENCKSRSELESHMKTHHQNRAANGTPHTTNTTGLGRHKCNICDQVCPTSTLLAEHKLTTHCKVLHSDLCSICKTNLANEEQFFSHMQKHCPNTVGNSENLTLPTACIICRQTVTSDSEVQLHAKFHLHQKLQQQEFNNTKEEYILNCKECTSRFDNVNDLELHYTKFHSSTNFIIPSQNRINENNPSYECISCQISFSTEQEVRTHVESTHSTDDTQKCHLCQEIFDTPLKLQCHLIEHTFVGCPTFACYLCGSVFTASTGLQRHMISHGPNSKPYDCNKCHLKFYFRSELENHAFIHDQINNIENNDIIKPKIENNYNNNINNHDNNENSYENTKIKNENNDEEEDEEQSEAISLTISTRKRKGCLNENNDSPTNGEIISAGKIDEDTKRLKSEPIEEQT